MSRRPLEVWIEEQNLVIQVGMNGKSIYSSIQGAVKHNSAIHFLLIQSLAFPCLFFLVCKCFLCTCSFCQPHWETIFKLIMSISIYIYMHVYWSDRFAQGCKIGHAVGRVWNYRDSWDLCLSLSLVHHCFTYDPLLQLVLCQLLELTG